MINANHIQPRANVQISDISKQNANQVIRSVDWLSWCCLSPFTKYVLPIFLTCVLVVLGVYFGLLGWLPSGLGDFENHQSTCHLQPIYYVPCLPKTTELEQDKCLEVGCCWQRDTGLCYHPFPSPYGYRIDGQSGDGEYSLAIADLESCYRIKAEEIIRELKTQWERMATRLFSLLRTLFSC